MLLLFFIFAQLCLAAQLNLKETGALCLGIVGSEAKPGKISLYIDSVTTSDDEAMHDLSFPLLIFRYKDIKDYPSLPIVKEYYERYNIDRNALYENLVDFDKKQFNLGADPVLPVYNSYVMFDQQDGQDLEHVDVNFPVTSPGIYCVYVAPPTDKGIKSFEIPINYAHSHGKMPYESYITSTQYKYVLLVALALTAYLFNYILKFKVGKDFKNLGSISILSKGIIFFVLLPYCALMFFRILISVAENNTNLDGWLCFWGHIDSWMSLLFMYLWNFYILIFCMGYGVVYYHTENSRNFRVMPAGQLYKAIGLLIFSLVVSTLVTLALTRKPDNGGPNLPIPYVASNTMVAGSSEVTLLGPTAIVLILNGLLTPVWFVALLRYYFKTKKLIAEFPPASGSGDSSADLNVRIVLSFRKSIFVIFVLPIVVGMAIGVLLTLYAMKSIGDGFGGSEREEDAVLYELMELMLFSLQSLVILWCTTFMFFAQIAGLFLIWIKDNNGLVVDGATEFDVELEDEI